MPNLYKGMRWLKCDLQMQTLANARHWAGDRLEALREAAAAKAFAEACFRQRLDVVGITDHNFLSKDFIPHLQAAFECQGSCHLSPSRSFKQFGLFVRVQIDGSNRLPVPS